VQSNFYFIGNYSNIYKKPSKLSEVTTQIICGEKFKILSKNKNWIKIKLLFDNYVGYIQNKQFTQKTNLDYKVSDLKARIFKKPNVGTKSYLTFGSKVSAVDENKNYIKIQKNKWIKKTDIIKIFKKFLQVEYVWGGKSYKGIDCSALLQIFFYYNNLFYPRDTKDQIKYSRGKIIKKKFKKGDIIFWKGHVAICLNSKKLIHAYGPEKKVLIMPIIKTINRIRETANLEVKKIARINF
jgi:cell wall-associated NlpC family hydrolase